MPLKKYMKRLFKCKSRKKAQDLREPITPRKKKRKKRTTSKEKETAKVVRVKAPYHEEDGRPELPRDRKREPRTSLEKTA